VLGASIVAVESCVVRTPTPPLSVRERLARAEDLLKSGYEVIEKAEQTANASAARQRQAAARLARLYDVWNTYAPSDAHAADAARWRDRASGVQ
jgi:hypothetical protein